MEDVEDLYALSPMQEMMLLHSMSAGKDDVLFNQVCYEVRGELDVPALRRAWQDIVDRHPILRTAFLWDGLKQPLQVVRRRAALPFQYLDWQDRPAPAQEQALEAFRREDQARGFDPTTAPLTRVSLIHLADDVFVLVWSSHHLLLDRWCFATIFDEVWALYEAHRRSHPPPMNGVRPYRDYIAWIKRQDAAEAKAFWRQQLGGFRDPTAMTIPQAPADALDHAARDASIALSVDASAALRRFARQQGLTASVLFQGALALTLYGHCGRQDVLFGVAVSGRPPDLAGVDSILGSFVNNLPARIRLFGDESVIDWLRSIQAAQQSRSAFEHVSSATIQDWCDLPPSRRLFDTLLVWLSGVPVAHSAGLSLQDRPNQVKTAYPLSLSVADDEAFLIRAACGRGHRTVVAPVELLEDLRAGLEALLRVDSATRLADLPGFHGLHGRGDEAQTSGPEVSGVVQEEQAAEDGPKASPKGRGGGWARGLPGTAGGGVGRSARPTGHWT